MVWLGVGFIGSLFVVLPVSMGFGFSALLVLIFTLGIPAAYTLYVLHLKDYRDKTYEVKETTKNPNPTNSWQIWKKDSLMNKISLGYDQMEIDLEHRLTIDDKFKPYLLYGLYELNRVWIHEEWHIGIFIKLNGNDKSHCRSTISYGDCGSFKRKLNCLRKEELSVRDHFEVSIFQKTKKFVDKLFLEKAYVKKEDEYLFDETTYDRY